MVNDRQSKVPRYSFPESIDAQRTALRSNPLLARMNKARSDYEDDHRPLFHYVNPEGRLNDPNGLCFWQGHWHLFYQAYPPEDPRQHWGHAVSEDLVRWRDLPYCIYPDPEERCFSGATLVEENRVIAMYHGTKAGNMIATSSDPLLLNWQKLGNKPVIPMASPNESPLPYNVFDPCIWKSDEYYYSLSAGQLADGPAGQCVATDFLFKSRDLEKWEYLHPFIEGDRFSRVGDDGACPYFLPIGSKHILLFFSHTSGGQYLLGDYDREEQKFHVTFGEKFNFGPAGPGGVHAPSATALDDGSVVVIFNMNPGKPTTRWDQVMSLPRKLTLGEDGNSVDVEVFDTVGALRERQTISKSVEVSANQTVVLPEVSGDSYELEIEIQSLEANVFAIDVLRNEAATEFTRISLYRDRGYVDRANYVRDRTSLVTLDNSYSSLLPDVRARAPEILDVPISKDAPVKLRIFVDRSIVEVFVNQLRAVAVRVYPSSSDSTSIAMHSRGLETTVDRLSFYRMADIYEKGLDQL